MIILISGIVLTIVIALVAYFKTSIGSLSASIVFLGVAFVGFVTIFNFISKPAFNDIPDKTINIVAFSNGRGTYFCENETSYTYMINTNGNYKIETIDKYNSLNKENEVTIVPIGKKEIPRIEVCTSYNILTDLVHSYKYIVYIPKDSITTDNYSINVEN